MLKSHEINEIIEQLGRGTDGYIIVREDLLRRLLEVAPRDVVAPLLGQPATRDMLPAADDVLVHKKVRRIREAHRITQARLASTAGVRQPDISDFEKNGPSGYTDRVPRIVEALGKLIGSAAAP